MGLERIHYYLREYFFPQGCGACAIALLDIEDVNTGLCGKCRSIFESAFAGQNRCRYCGRQLISEIETCLSCREKEAAKNGRFNEYFIKQRALFPYTGKFRLVLRAYKFGKSLGLGNYFVRFLNMTIKDLDDVLIETPMAYSGAPSGCQEAAWVPVPPKPGKIKTHGWDQIEFLAGLLEKAKGRNAKTLPVCRCLKRLSSRSQKKLNRDERGKNLKGRIICVKPPPRTAILFDDVITTGATLNACAEALLKGGAGKVYGICLFYD